MPVAFQAGGVLRPSSIQGEPYTPLEEQLSTLTVDQVKAVYHAMGLKLVKGSEKASFVQFAINHWQEATTRGLAIERNYERIATGVKKLVMFKRDDTYFIPILLRAGQVFYPSFFNNLRDNVQLTMEMLNTLTAKELLNLHRELDNGGIYDTSDGKKLIVERLLSFWNFNYERFNANRGNIAAEPVEMLTDDEDENQSDSGDDFTFSIEDYLGLADEEVSQQMLFDLSSPADFYDNPRRVEVRALKEDTVLMTVFVDGECTTVAEVKRSIEDKISILSKEENRLTADDFILSNGIELMADCHNVPIYQTQVYILLRFRGGGKGVKQFSKREKVKRTLALAKDSYNALGSVKFDTAFLTRIEALIQEMMNNESEDYISKKLSELTTEQLMSIKSGTEDFKITDATLRRLAPLVVHDIAHLIKLIQELEAAKKTAETCFVHVFSQEFYEGKCGATAFWHKYERALGKVEGASSSAVVSGMEAMKL